jgi:hypothetical protein
MDVFKILAELRQEREQVEESIVSLERLAAGKRGRFPAWACAHKPRGRPPTGSGAGSGGGTPFPSYPRPRVEDCPTRRRRTPGNPDLKG